MRPFVTPTLSAVVVTHNSADVIERCLGSLRGQLPNAEVIVIDNASSDKTSERCDEVSGVRLLRNAANTGFGRACNQGARYASGSHVLFLNPDVQLLEADDANLNAELAHHPFGLIGPHFRDRRRTGPTFLSEGFWPFEVLAHGLGPLRPRELPALPRPRRRQNTWWPTGAALICSRAEFLAIGGFRREFFLYYEDRDLARRYHVARLPVRTTGSIVVHHTPGTSSASDDSLRIAAGGWAYLGWLEYLSCWHGDATARRANAYVERLRAAADRGLALLEARGPLSARARRKRVQLRSIEEFVKRQSTRADGSADEGFCPHAKLIIAGRRG